jgi:hypothetical protein
MNLPQRRAFHPQVKIGPVWNLRFIVVRRKTLPKVGVEKVLVVPINLG